MPNAYFQFKQFTVYQEHSAMKVCTDACLFGAWVVNSIETSPQKILDIGTGTGLLSLMMAQKWPAVINAVEINDSAIVDARRNFADSPWQKNIHLIHKPVQQLHVHEKFDLIISNPPFYSGDLASDDAARNTALHSSELSLEDLFKSVSTLLKADGLFALLIAARRMADVERHAKQMKWNIIKKTGVRQSPDKLPFRYMYLFATTGADVYVESEIVIKDASGNYSDAFRGLLKDYYLHL